MILIAQKSLPRHFKLEGQKNFLSLLPQFWQELEGIPYSLKMEKIGYYPKKLFAIHLLIIHLIN